MFDKEGMEKVISAAVLNALEDKAAPLLAEMVDRMLKLEVDMDTGGKPSYSAKDKGTYLEFAAQSQMRILIGQTIGEWIKGNSAEIKRQVTAKLDAGKVAQAYVDALVRQVEGYGFHVNLSVKRDD